MDLLDRIAEQAERAEPAGDFLDRLAGAMEAKPPARGDLLDRIAATAEPRTTLTWPQRRAVMGAVGFPSPAQAPGIEELRTYQAEYDQFQPWAVRGPEEPTVIGAALGGMGRGIGQFLNSFILRDLDRLVSAGLRRGREFVGVVPERRAALPQDAAFRAATGLEPTLRPSRADELRRERAAYGLEGPRVALDMPPARNWAEQAIDASAGVAAFIARIAVIDRVIPQSILADSQPLRAALVWELENQASAGPPLRGAVWSLTLSGLGYLGNMPIPPEVAERAPAGIRTLAQATKLRKYGATAATSGLFWWTAKKGQADLTDQIIAAAIPWVMRAAGDVKLRLQREAMMREAFAGNSWARARYTAELRFYKKHGRHSKGFQLRAQARLDAPGAYAGAELTPEKIRMARAVHKRTGQWPAWFTEAAAARGARLRGKPRAVRPAAAAPQRPGVRALLAAPAAGRPAAAVPPREAVPLAEPVPTRPPRARAGEPKRIRVLREQIFETRERLREVEQIAKPTPPESKAAGLLREELAALREAADKATTVPRRYAEELARQTPRQLVTGVRKLRQKASPEERALAGRLEVALKHAANLGKGLEARLQAERIEFPVLDWLRGTGRRIGFAPGRSPFGTEIAEQLQGQPREVRQFFRRAKKGERVPPEEFPGVVLKALQLEGLMAEGATEDDLVAHIIARAEATGFRGSLAAAVETEQAQIQALGPEAEGQVGPFESAARELDNAEARVEELAGQLRDARAREVAIDFMPAATKAARIIEVEIAHIEGIAARATEAKKAELDQEAARLHEKLAQLEQQLAEDKGLPELRRYIAQLRTKKGISQARFGEIVASCSEPLPGGRRHRTTRGIEDKRTLMRILALLERARPKFVGSRTVITAKRERHIQELRQKLTRDGGSTHADFIRQMQQLRIASPRYVNAQYFCTEQKAVRLIDRMIDEAPLIRHRQETDRALSGNPQMAAVVDADRTRTETLRTKMEAKGRKARLSEFVDIRYYFAGMDEQTGAPFYDAGMAMVRAKRDVELSVVRDFDRIEAAVGSEAYKRIAADRAALDRVNDAIASKLKRRGAPPPPQGLTQDEARMAQAIEAVLHDQRNQVRWERFLRWRFKGRPIPDAPARELTRAMDLYESQGPDAARAYLDGRAWGVIKSGYEPESVVIPRLHVGPEPPIRYGDRGIEAREATFQRQDKNILVRLSSYLYRRYNAAILTPQVRAFVTLWDANADRFEKPGRTARNLGYVISEMQGAPAGDQPLARWTRRLYSHALLAKVLIPPAKSLRNICQTMAFYTDRSDLVNARNRALTAEERAYYEAYVSQLPGLRRDLFMEQERPLFRLDRWVRLARRIAPYRFSDEYPRHSCFWAKLNRVERALRQHPDSVRRMLNAAAIQDLDPRQVRAAIEILARDGEDAFKRFVSHEVTNNVHFVYGREQRAVAEAGEIGRVVGNLLTFPRSYVQRVAKELNKLVTGKTHRDRWRALKTLLSMIAGGMLVGEGYRRVWGLRRNPYNPLQILNWQLGGLMAGAADVFSDLVWQTESALMGDRGALDRALRALAAVPDMFLPGYAEVLDTAEAVTGTRKLDVYAARRLRAALSKRYKPGDPRVERTMVEKAQKIVAGGADRPLTELASLDALNLARRYGVDVRDVYGTLKDGRVGLEDVKRHLGLR